MKPLHLAALAAASVFALAACSGGQDADTPASETEVAVEEGATHVRVGSLLFK